MLAAAGDLAGGSMSEAAAGDLTGGSMFFGYLYI